MSVIDYKFSEGRDCLFYLFTLRGNSSLKTNKQTKTKQHARFGTKRPELKNLAPTLLAI